MNDFPSFETNYKIYLAAQAEANDHNKAVVLNAITQAAITKVTVTFDGEGDSGQIENMTAFVGDVESDFPTIMVLYGSVSYSNAHSCRELLLSEAIEHLCYDYLSQLHGGWENNDGAFGEFTIDVANRTIELEFNGRYVEHSTETTTL